MPLYTKESLETLRQRIDLIEVLSGHLNLKRTGSSYKALCPFHDEKSPSFIVQKGDTHYHCFGCGAHGDAIQFLMNYLKVGFGEAVESLAERFHVPLEWVEKVEEKGIHKTLLKESLEIASQFFHFYLLHTEEGSEAQDYLLKRGLNLDFIRRFEVGLAPKASGLMRKVLHAKEIPDQTLKEAGLLGERGGEFFRERITFPIRNAAGQIIGFSARKYKEETYGGKYINTSETSIFKKSRVLFGLNYSRRRIAKERRAIIVEGQIDCLRLIEAGFNIAVAALGTAFGEGHVRELQQIGVRQVFLMLDPDAAGREAASKVGNLFQKVGIEVTVVILPEGNDPDAFLIRFGPQALMERMEKGVDYLSFQVQHLSRDIHSDSPAGKTELVKALTSQIKEWEQPIMIHESLRKVASLVRVPEEMVGVGQAYSPHLYVKKNASLQMTEIDPHRVLELDLLRWLILLGDEHPSFVDIAKTYLTPMHFWVPICRTLFEAFFQAVNENNPRDLLSLFISVHAEEAQLCLEEILQKKINRERAVPLFRETVQKLLDRQWMQEREEVKREIHSGKHSEEEILTLAKRFDDLKKCRPQVCG